MVTALETGGTGRAAVGWAAEMDDAVEVARDAEHPNSEARPLTAVHQQ